jgi:hypothetical protein
MHQYKTITQILLVLSILNSVFAAPTVPREARDTGNDVVVVADDVTAVSGRRRGETSSSQHPPPVSDGSPLHGSLPLYDSASFQGSGSSSKPAPLSPVSATDGEILRVDATDTHPLSTADGHATVPISNTEESTPFHPSSSTASPAPVHDSTAAGPKTSQYTVVTYDMLDKDPPSKEVVATKKYLGLALFAGAVGGVALLSLLHNKHNKDD